MTHPHTPRALSRAKHHGDVVRPRAARGAAPGAAVFALVSTSCTAAATRDRGAIGVPETAVLDPAPVSNSLP
jgi:hypothetical protein